MKTRLLTTLTAALLALSSYAAGTKIGGIHYVLNSRTKTASVTYTGSKFSNNTYSGNITIPASVTYRGRTYSVKSIGEAAFWDCTGLTSITIPNSVTSIGYKAFFDCTGLTSVTIPNSVTSIGDAAFGRCSGLTSIKVAAGNTKYDSRDNCNAIIKTASNTLVAGCKTTTIGNSVTSIGEDAFSGCDGLTSITIPNSVTSSIGNWAFRGCDGLTSISIGNSVTSIGDQAFAHCTGLTSINIPNSVTSIGVRAFIECTGLTSINIPSSVKRIEDQAFTCCDGLTSVTIGNSVTSIGRWAFSGCTDLTSVTALRTNPKAYNCDYEAFDDVTTLHVPKGCKTAYKNCEPWSNCGNIIDDAKAK